MVMLSKADSETREGRNNLGMDHVLSAMMVCRNCTQDAKEVSIFNASERICSSALELDMVMVDSESAGEDKTGSLNY